MSVTSLRSSPLTPSAPLPGPTLARLSGLIASARSSGPRLALLEGGRQPSAIAEALRAAGVPSVLVASAEAPYPSALASLVDAALTHVAARRRAPSFDRSALGCGCGCHALFWEHASLGNAPLGGAAEVRGALERRVTFLHALERLLADVAADGPLGLVISIAQDDHETEEVLRHLFERPLAIPGPDRSQLVVIATGPGAARLRGVDGAISLAAEALDEDALRAWLATPEVVRSLLARTGGRLVALERLLDGIPTDEREVVLHAEHALGAPARALLDALAVLGRAATLPELAQVAAIELDEGLAARVGSSALLVARTSAPMSSGVRRADATLLEFARDGDRACFLDALSDARRSELERRAGELERGRDDAAAARHLLRGGRVDEALAAALDATSVLHARHAHGAASELLSSLIAELPEDPGESARMRLVELAWAAGDLAAALHHAREVAIARPADARAWLRLGTLETLCERFADADATLARADELARDAGDPRCALEVEIERADLAYRTGELCLAAERATHAAALADGADALELSLAARNTLAKVRITEGALDEAAQLLAAMLKQSAAAGLADTEFAAASNLGIVALRKNQLAQAQELFERGAELAARGRSALHRAIAAENLGVLHHLAGRFAQARAGYHEAAELLKRLGHRAMLSRAVFNLADLHLAMGDPYRARDLGRFAAQLGGHHPSAPVHAKGQLVAARVELELGSGPRARAIAEPLRESSSERVRVEAEIVTARALAAEGRAEEADALLRAIDEPGGARLEAHLELARAEVALSRGTDAVSAARVALGAAERTGSTRTLVSALLVLSRALAAAGLEDAAATALARADEAEELVRAALPPELRELFVERTERRAATRAVDTQDRAPIASTPPPPRTSVARALLGTSEPMRRVRAWIKRVGPTDGIALVTGESGTGKELVAEALHAASPRNGGPFVKVNCAALVETLLLSELFGHERGAFTGATATRKGRFELADGGTLFLDEIGDITPRTQVALLRALQERTFERVGGTKSLRVDIRVIAATNRNLPDLVSKGQFREDLYYRLRGLAITLPPLRDRLSDLPALCDDVLDRLARETGGARKRLTDATLAMLGKERWPGNVRELENVLRAVALLAEGTVLDVSDFQLYRDPLAPRIHDEGERAPLDERALPERVYDHIRAGGGSIYDVRRDIERACIERALGEARGNIAKAAALLGMKRPRLSQLVKEHGLKTRELW